MLRTTVGLVLGSISVGLESCAIWYHVCNKKFQSQRPVLIETEEFKIENFHPKISPHPHSPSSSPLYITPTPPISPALKISPPERDVEQKSPELIFGILRYSSLSPGYVIKVTTSPWLFSGTDARVYVNLVGANGDSTGSISLHNSIWDFESGR